VCCCYGLSVNDDDDDDNDISVVGLLGYAMCYVLCCVFPNGMDAQVPWYSVVLGWQRTSKYAPKDFQTQVFFQF